jgi:hypothetical protein
MDGYRYNTSCGISLLGDPQTLEQVACLEKKSGKKLDARRAEIIERDRAAFEALVSQCVITESRYKAPVGGVVKVPAYLNEEPIKEKIKRFCNSQNSETWDIISVKRASDYVGNRGGGSTYCTQYGCSGSSSSHAVYEHFNEVNFNCN